MISCAHSWTMYCNNLYNGLFIELLNQDRALLYLLLLKFGVSQDLVKKPTGGSETVVKHLRSCEKFALLFRPRTQNHYICVCDISVHGLPVLVVLPGRPIAGGVELDVRVDHVLGVGGLTDEDIVSD